RRDALQRRPPVVVTSVLARVMQHERARGRRNPAPGEEKRRGSKDKKEENEPGEPEEPPPLHPTPLEPHAAMIAGAGAVPVRQCGAAAEKPWPALSNPARAGRARNGPALAGIEGPLIRSVPIVRLGILWRVAVLVLAAIAGYLYYQ